MRTIRPSPVAVKNKSITREAAPGRLVKTLISDEGTKKIAVAIENMNEGKMPP